MASDRQRRANRDNALKSTGPKSHRGKRHSRFNALKLGLRAKQRLLPGEDASEYRRLEKQLLRELSPKGPLQEIYFDRLLEKEWARRRNLRAERHLLEQENSEMLTEIPDGLNPELLGYILPLIEKHQSMILPSATASETRRDEADAESGRAVVRSLVVASRGGQLTRLQQDRRLLERDFERNLFALRAEQQEHSTIDVVPTVVQIDAKTTGFPEKAKDHDGAKAITSGSVVDSTEARISEDKE